ncbi:unnamed protein product [Adineta steineri]|uniref:Cytosolic fatty-acid binding proteins domain-containing protein n=1 Tax=Adineta steineri TaxID=433720 RepID=A0A819EAS3_9BILA|nr:unnamed protein product [Adineta steineri]
MTHGKSVEALKGTWDYVGDENMDAFMKKIGVGMAMRLIVKGIKPRVVISENDGKWTLRSENAVKTISFEFTPNVESDETTPDGREVKTIVQFKGDKWEQTTRDKHGKEWVSTRYVDDQGQQQFDMKCGEIKARRWFKRVE